MVVIVGVLYTVDGLKGAGSHIFWVSGIAGEHAVDVVSASLESHANERVLEGCEVVVAKTGEPLYGGSRFGVHLTLGAKNCVAVTQVWTAHFLDGLVNKVYEFGGGKVLEHIGGIYDYLSKKKLDSLQQLELSKSPTKPEAPTKAAQINDNTNVSLKATSDVSENKLSYQEQKELNSKIRKVERQIEDIEKKIESHENEISVMETYLATPEGASDMDYLQKYVEVKAKLDKVMNKWERMTLELEKLQENR